MNASVALKFVCKPTFIICFRKKPLNHKTVSSGHKNVEHQGQKWEEEII